LPSVPPAPDHSGSAWPPTPTVRLLDRAGQASDTLWAIGPLRRGALLETTAIPEIREQAAALARTVPEAAASLELGFVLEEAM
jgi:uncharacterized NAD(P)/FAD-binding protein YdhS